MVNTNLADQNDTDGDGFACPIFRAFPHLWLNQKKCISYWATDLKGTLIRHHLFGYHEKLNDKISVDDARYLPPEVFDEIRRCKKDKRCANDATTWRTIYARVKGTDMVNAATQDPYWTPSNLYTILHSILDSASASSHVEPCNNAIPWHHLSHLEKLTELHDMETSMMTDIESLEESYKELLRSRFHQLRMRVATSSTEPIPAGSFSLSNQPGDSQSTQGAGTLFPDANSLEPLLDVDMQGNMSGHDDIIFHNSSHSQNAPFSEWSDKENLQFDSELTHGTYTSRQPYQSIASVSRNGSMGINHTSSQATLAATPPQLPFLHRPM